MNKRFASLRRFLRVHKKSNMRFRLAGKSVRRASTKLVKWVRKHPMLAAGGAAAVGAGIYGLSQLLSDNERRNLDDQRGVSGLTSGEAGDLALSARSADLLAAQQRLAVISQLQILIRQVGQSDLSDSDDRGKKKKVMALVASFFQFLMVLENDEMADFGLFCAEKFCLTSAVGFLPDYDVNDDVFFQFMREWEKAPCSVSVLEQSLLTVIEASECGMQLISS